VPPKISKKGRVANSCTPAKSGTQSAGEPSAHEGGQIRGAMGAKPSGKGYGGCPFTPTKVSLFEKGRPSPTITKAGGQEGGSPLPGGPWGRMCPLARGRGKLPLLPAKSGASLKTLGADHKPKAGVQGAQPPPGGVPPKWGMWWTLSPRGWAPKMAGGVGDVPPKFQRGGKLANSCTPPRVGPKTLANPSAHEGGQRGVQGGEAPWRGCGGCPPKPKRGANPCNPATSGTKNPGKPSAHGGGKCVISSFFSLPFGAYEYII